jgi:hypothetical protein
MDGRSLSGRSCALFSSQPFRHDVWQAHRGAKTLVRKACHLEVLSVVCPMQYRAAMTEELALDASKLSSLFGDALPVQWARQTGGLILR